MSKLSSIVCLLLGLLLVSPCFGQTQTSNESAHTLAIEIPAVSLVKVVGDNQVKLQLSKPTEAGLPINQLVADSSFWLNYSFIQGSGSRPYNHVYAKLESGNIPPGTSLTVYAKNYQGAGEGNFGSPTGEVELSQNESRVIQNISSCFTGTGTGNGHQLVYQLKLITNAYHLVETVQSQPLSIVYTISD